jgi:hypothetical protein
MTSIKEEIAIDIVHIVRNGPELGHLCDYCNIKQGWSIIFNSFDDYLNHVVKNHPGLKACHNNTTDLDAFEENSRKEWEQFLKKCPKEYLEHFTDLDLSVFLPLSLHNVR